MANRVLWMPTGPRSKSSSRIQVYNIHDKLLSMGYDSQLVFEPKRTIWQLPLNTELIDGLKLTEDDLVIVQKFKKKSTKDFIRKIKSYDAHVGYIDCDEPIVPEIAELADFVIVPSSFLKDRYETFDVKCFAIEDSPEKFIVLDDTYKSSSENLKCVWFGNHSISKWKEVLYFKKLLKRQKINDWSFETISNTWRSTHRWNSNSFEQLTKYDLVVIPVPDVNLDYKVKSSNRLLQSMALGVPVLASPIPSYVDIARKHNLENMLCETEEDWSRMLEYYKNSNHREEAIKKNLEVANSYRLDHIIDEWINAFDLVKTSKAQKLEKDVLEKIKFKARLRGYELKFA